MRHSSLFSSEHTMAASFRSSSMSACSDRAAVDAPLPAALSPVAACVEKQPL